MYFQITFIKKSVELFLTFEKITIFALAFAQVAEW